MISPLTYRAHQSHLDQVARTAKRTRRPAPRPATRTADGRDIVVRSARERDASALTLLAALDSSHTPAGDVLVALVDGQPVAALQVSDGTTVADPFMPTVDAVALLRSRARRLSRPVGSGTRRRFWRAVTAAGR